MFNWIYVASVYNESPVFLFGLQCTWYLCLVRLNWWRHFCFDYSFLQMVDLAFYKMNLNCHWGDNLNAFNAKLYLLLFPRVKVWRRKGNRNIVLFDSVFHVKQNFRVFLIYITPYHSQNLKRNALKRFSIKFPFLLELIK